MTAGLRVGGIILCGGESRRMGTPKAWLQFDNEYLLQRIARAAAPAASPIVLATRHGMALPPLIPELGVAYDQSEHAGPLAGIAAGMAALRDKAEAALVLACDHPLLMTAVVERMIELLGEYRAVVPELGGRLFPTLAVYRLETLTVVEEMLGSGDLRAQEFARRCRPRRVGEVDLADIDPELRSFCNMNEPAEYQTALNLSNRPAPKGRECEH